MNITREINFKGILIAIIKKWWLLAGFFLVAMIGLNVVGKSTVQISYVSNSQIIVINEKQVGEATDNQSRLLHIYDSIELLKSEEFLQRVLQQKEFNITVDELRNSLKIEQKPTSRVIEISVTLGDKNEVQEIVKTIAEQSELYLGSIFGEESTQIISEASLAKPLVIGSGMTPKRIVLVSLALTIVLVFLIMFLYVINNAIKCIDDIKLYIGKECLGSIKKVNKNKKMSALDIQKIRMNLLHTQKTVFTVTSTVRGEGKSEISFELVKDLAQIGKKVLLIDANFLENSKMSCMQEKTPKFYDLELESGKGLTECIHTVEKYNFDCLYCSVNPEKQGVFFLNIDFKKALNGLKESYDYIIIDTISMEEGVDAITMADNSDAVIFVIEAHGTGVNRVCECLEEFNQIEKEEIYLILNKEQGLGKLFKRINGKRL